MTTNITVDNTLKTTQVQEFVLKILLSIFKLAKNSKAEAKITMILNILILASVERKTINRVCKDRKNTYSGVTVRNTLKLLFSSIDETEKMLNELLRKLVHKDLLKCAPIICTDFVDIEYYGKPIHEKDINKTKRRNGTTKFYRYSTLYINMNGHRYTIALTYVRAGESTLEVLKRLNRYLLYTDITPSLWLLDRGYYSVEVIKWLRATNKPFIMPTPKTGRKPSHPKGATGTNVFQCYKKSCFAKHTLRASARDKFDVSESITTDVAIVITYPKGRGQYKSAQVLVYACFSVFHMPFYKIRRLYRTRFSIETSYRQMNEARTKTATKSPVLRLIFVGVSLIIRNVWVYLHFHVFYIRKLPGGQRKISLDSFTFTTMLSWLRCSLEQIFPLIQKLVVSDISRLQALQHQFSSRL